MPLSSFHPVVASWFQQRFGEPTPPQVSGWEAIRSGRHTLIAAPTGSGKTLAAFLHSLDQLFREGLEAPLPEETRVVYVSPLKALSADIHLNLAEPRREIRRLAEELGFTAPRITAAVRSGDTPAADRAAMIRKPPHILVTTPESLYLLLTAQRSREMLRTVETVIVDEIHAVVESRRGAHLALTLERLDHVARQPVQRIGLSATVKPIREVGQWLVGAADRRTRGPADLSSSDTLPGLPARIIDAGHRRALDLALELPKSPLEAVMSGDVWGEVYDRVTELIKAHKTTIVFVNTRRLAERVARHLGERLGDEAVTAHHGSLSKEVRLAAEERLKGGRLQALVATASLELGIDIGHVDLVCQLGTPRRISTFLQRVGRSGHTVHGMPKGRLFPLTRDELVECTAIISSVHKGELDRIVIRDKPLDVLAQHIVAETAAEDWAEDDLYLLCSQAYPYRNLERTEFDDVVRMLASGFATRRGRRGALIHHDGVNHRIRGRRGARLLAITSGGAIPDNADYRVVLEPDNTFIGTVNEDFAVESLQGDIFQLGNTSWRILGVQQGTVRVEDAHGQPPSIPFWLGESPARSNELSEAVSELRRGVEERLPQKEQAVNWVTSILSSPHPERGEGSPSGSTAAHQLVEYLAESKRLLGELPTVDTIVAERFFDEAGGMQLVIHSPFGSRVNRAWGLALRKRFCRQFNFELQAAATEDSLLLSLGPQHSFPLETVFRFLHPDTAEEILVQALLDAPMFGTHWRWNGNIALAIPRSRGGRKTPPQIQRMQAEDLLAAAFPDAAACLENIPGDREIPDHPLVRQTIDDCVHEVMDVDGLKRILDRIHSGEVRLVARDLPEPSPLAHEILNARPYAFLDDAPAEERRTQAVYTRRAFEPSSADDLGALDAAAIERVRDEAWPEIQNADELHDTLLTSGFLTELEGISGRDGHSWGGYFQELVQAGRAVRRELAQGQAVWAAMERAAEVDSIAINRVLADGARDLRSAVPREDAIRELLRGRLGVTGPATASQLAASLNIAHGEADVALAALESEGVILRGHFTKDTPQMEWCERRLLAQGYDPDMVEKMEGAGTRAFKHRGGMAYLGATRIFANFRMGNSLALLDAHIRGVGPDEAKGSGAWDSYSFHTDLPPGHPMVAGEQTNDWEFHDAENAGLILVWGMNWITTKMPDSHWLTEARLKGAHTVAITVEYSATASRCDDVIVIRPGTDPAFALGVAQVLIDEGLYDESFVKRFTDLPTLVRLDTLERLAARDVFPDHEESDLTNWTHVLEEGESAPPPPQQAGMYIPHHLRQAFGDYVVWDEAAGEPVAVGRDKVGDHFADLGIDPALTGTFTVQLANGEEVEVRPVFDLVKQYLDDNMTPAQASAITWAPETAFIILARHMGANRGRTLAACGMGPNQFWNNDNKDRAIWLIMALTGSLGRHGGNIGSYAGNYKATMFTGVPLFASEDPFNPQLDPDGEVRTRSYLRYESMHYWANGERILKAGDKTITTGAHVPTPTKAIWQSNSNSSLGNQKWHFDVVFNTLPRCELVV
jgi:ATP-dependent helicase Lhr and Lhr-like helicase